MSDVTYKTTYECSDCNHIFYVVTDKKPSGFCPSCPKCQEDSSRNRGAIKSRGKSVSGKTDDEKISDVITSRKAPGVGGSKIGKAHEATMKMVMEDYGLTDINDRPTEGESCAPKLPAHLEQQVNNGFGASFGSMSPKLTGNMSQSMVTSSAMNAINSGQFKNHTDVVAQGQKYLPKPKFNILNEY